MQGRDGHAASTAAAAPTLDGGRPSRREALAAGATAALAWSGRTVVAALAGAAPRLVLAASPPAPPGRSPAPPPQGPGAAPARSAPEVVAVYACTARFCRHFLPADGDTPGVGRCAASPCL